jgi:putative NADPH-quinone reductase
LRFCFPSFWMRVPHLLTRYAGALLRQGLSYPLSAAPTGPERFSVLLVELARRQDGPLVAAD